MGCSFNTALTNDASGLFKAKLSEVTIPAGDHRLQSAYCLWYSRKGSGKQQQLARTSFPDPFENNFVASQLNMNGGTYPNLKIGCMQY